MAPPRSSQPKKFSPEVVKAITDEVLGSSGAPHPTRYPKGVSGNPDGRPHGTKKPKAPKHGSAIAAKAAEVARRPVKVRDGDGEREITIMDAAMMQLGKQAASGNVPAIRLLAEKVSEFEAIEHELRAAEQADWARRRTHWEAYVDRNRPLFDAAKANGLAPPEIYPHPDDLVFEEDGTLRIIGPVCAETAIDYAKIVSETDYWLAMIAYDWWRGSRGGPFSSRAEYTYVAEILFWQHQDWLPPRMRMTETAIVSTVMWLRRLSGRKLHRRLSELGHKANLYVPPWRAQIPTTVPTDLCLEANRNGISFEHFLEMWGKALKQDASEKQSKQNWG